MNRNLNPCPASRARLRSTAPHALTLAMEEELRSGRLVGYLIAIPCLIAAIFTLLNVEGSVGVFLLSFCFGLGVILGVHLIVRPKTLVRVSKGIIELYPGSLFVNKKQIEVPLHEIEGFEVKTVSDGDGKSWLLSLYLSAPPTITTEANCWINTNVPKSVRDESNGKTILWSLSWPEGGVRGAREKIKKTNKTQQRNPIARSAVTNK